MVVQAVRTASKEQKVVRSFHASLPLAAAVAAYLRSCYIHLLSRSWALHAFSNFYTNNSFVRVISRIRATFRASKNSELETPLKTSDIGEINI